MTQDNIYTFETDYDSLQEAVNKILTDRGAKRKMLTFSMFDDIDDDHNSENWRIKTPDLSKVFANGKVKFLSGRGFKTKIINDPKWADVIYYANESILWGMSEEGLDGWDHVFLDSIDLIKKEKGVKVFEFWFGS
jgi:hypothetical protein